MSDASIAEFERRVRESQRMVYQVAFGVLGDAADAEEVAQDAFVRAYRKLASLREPEKFRAWVARVSWRLALNRLRSSARARKRDTDWMEAQAPQVPNAESLAAEREFHSRLRGEIERLPEKLRSVLILCGIEELDARRVGAILEIPEGTVRSRLHLARRRLLEALSR